MKQLTLFFSLLCLAAIYAVAAQESDSTPIRLRLGIGYGAIALDAPFSDYPGDSVAPTASFSNPGQASFGAASFSVSALFGDHFGAEGRLITGSNWQDSFEPVTINGSEYDEESDLVIQVIQVSVNYHAFRRHLGPYLGVGAAVSPEGPSVEASYEAEDSADPSLDGYSSRQPLVSPVLSVGANVPLGVPFVQLGMHGSWWPTADITLVGVHLSVDFGVGAIPY